MLIATFPFLFQMNQCTYQNFRPRVALHVRVVKPLAAHTRIPLDNHLALLWPETGSTLVPGTPGCYLGAHTWETTIWYAFYSIVVIEKCLVHD